MRSLENLYERGQSPWYDNLSRNLITSGKLQDLIDQGVVGVTSNPTIFDQAISSSPDYDELLKECKHSGLDAESTYWELVCTDIAQAADLLKPVYEKTNGKDGYVSIEVSPMLAHKTAETISQANELFSRISKDNIMIKIPATPEGLEAIDAVIANSIPVNVTLIFSQSRYLEVVNAFKSGASKASSVPESVASFFVSRLDTKADTHLVDNPDLLGKAAIANATIVYSLFNDLFEDVSNNSQRPLWASTSTKNPAYSPTLYVDNLIAKHTVNTLPQATIDAINSSNGDFPAENLDANIDTANELWAQICDLTPMEAIMKELEDEGVSSFEQSYQSCLSSISKRLEEL
ncbi:MAG: transaldolase [Acidimicrobiia bacterium]